METERPDGVGELERYREDVRTIRELLQTVERRPIYENWTFYAWGILLLVGTAVDFLGIRFLHLDRTHQVLIVWLPVVVAGLVLETISYVRNARRQSVPLVSRYFVRLFGGVIGATAVVTVFVVLLYRNDVPQLVPVLLLLGLALSYFVFGQHPAYEHLIWLGYGVLAVGLMTTLVDPSDGVRGLVAGVAAGSSFVIAGVVGGRTLHTV